MPAFAAIIAQPIICLAFAFAFAFRRLWTFSGVVAAFATVEAAFALAFAAVSDEMQLAILLLD